MLITSEQLPDLWREVTFERARSSEKGIVVLHSVSEVDSACATRLVMRFLEQASERYSLYPISDFRDLRETMRAVLHESSEERTVVMVNCGATIFVKQLLEEDGIDAQNVRFVVVDSHRPVDARYNNPDDADHLLLLDADDPQGPAEVPAFSPLDEMTEDEYRALVEVAERSGSDDDASGSDGEGGDDDDDGGAGGGARAKRRRSHADAGPSGRGERAQAREQLRAVNARKAELEEYYACGSYYGKPAALSALSLIEQTTAALSMDDIWPAIVGVADQHVHQRAARDHYAYWHAQLKARLGTVPSAPATYADDAGVTRQAPAHSIDVRPAQDARLMLHRHWTLYDAMAHSPYVAPRMQTWREGGLSRMALVFVNMGLSLEQARIAFNTMQPAHKNINERLPAAVRGTALAPSELVFDSFEARWGFGFHLSASDAVHALTGLLVRGGCGGNDVNAADAGAADADADGEAARARRGEAACANFWDALSALQVSSPKAYQHLKEGIEQAKSLQRAVIKDGGLMITRRQLEANPAHHMQELNLHAIKPVNADRFRHPLALLRLAAFVRDAADVARAGRKSKWPLAAVGPDDGSGYCCVVGLRHKQLPRRPQFNVFGPMFQAVLQEEADIVRWDAGRDGFDAAVVWVHRDSVPTFMTELKIRLGQQAREAADAAAAERRRAAGGGDGDAAAATQEGEASGGEGEEGGKRRHERRRRRRGGGEAVVADADGEGDQ